MLKCTKDKNVKILMIIVPIILSIMGLILNISFIYISLISYLLITFIVPLFYGNRFKIFYFTGIIILGYIILVMYLDHNIKDYSNLFNISWIQSSVGYFSKPPIFPNKTLFIMLILTLLSMPVFINLIWASYLVSVVVIFDKILKLHGKLEYLFVIDCVNVIRCFMIGATLSEIIMLTPWFIQKSKVGVSNMLSPALILIIIGVTQIISYKSSVNSIRSQYNKVVLISDNMENIGKDKVED